MDRQVALDFRDKFRDARAAALRDAEGYQEVLFVLERLGSFLTRNIGSLGSYRDSIAEMARLSPLAEIIPDRCRDWHTPFGDLYELVREARNDALHQGAFARHLTIHAVQLCLVLEDALMNDSARIGEYMVTNPVCASLWEPISFIRQKMLENSFSNLPVFVAVGGQGTWHFISDHALAPYLRGEGDRQARLTKTLGEAVESGEIQLQPAKTVPPDTPFREALGYMWRDWGQA